MGKFKHLLFGLLIGFLVALAMRFTPVFHGPDSNIIKKKTFRDENGCYSLVPYIIECE